MKYSIIRTVILFKTENNIFIKGSKQVFLMPKKKEASSPFTLDMLNIFDFFWNTKHFG